MSTTQVQHDAEQTELQRDGAYEERLKRRILKTIHTWPGLTKAAVSNRLGMIFPTVFELVFDGLVRSGMVTITAVEQPPKYTCSIKEEAQ
jgi:hypothetical protein